MSDLRGFNANDVPESTFGAIPPGFVVVVATSSEKKPTKAGTGEYLQFVLDVLDEQYNSKKLWVRLNLWNPNATAVTIAQQELAAFCKAVEVPQPDDSTELLNKPFIVELGVEKDERGRETNKILKYHHISTSAESLAAGSTAKPAAPATTPAAAAAAAAPAAARPSPVWGTRT